MKKAYTLTLKNKETGELIGLVGLIDNNLELIIKGINSIMANGGEYYQSYANETKVEHTNGYITNGQYKDTVVWAMVSWDIDELAIIS